MTLKTKSNSFVRIYDNGWYFITGIKTRSCNCHYFYNDKPIHDLKQGNYITDYSRRHIVYEANRRPCKTCINILKSYSKIGLENRLI